MDMMELRRQVLMATPHRKTLTGDLVTFDADFVAPMRLTIPFSPVQDLHGYDNPWVGGSGENLMPTPLWLPSGQTQEKNGIKITGRADGSISVKGTSTSSGSTDFYLSSASASLNPLIVPEGNYTIIADGVNANVGLVFSGASGNNGFPYGDLRNTTSLPNKKTGTVTDGTKPFSYFIIRVIANATVDTIVYAQLIRGTTEKPWTPYENICPISGWSQAKVYDDPKYARTIWWNQKVIDGNFPDATNWRAYGGTLSIADNVATITLTGTVANLGTRIDTEPYLQRTAGHKYLSFAEVKVPKATTGGRFYTVGDRYISNISIPANTWTQISALTTEISNKQQAKTQFFLGNSATNGYVTGDSFQIRNVNTFDLTEMFGAGNEPATAEEFRALFPKAYYPYNAGEETLVSAVNGDPYSHVTVTFGQTVYSGYLELHENGSGQIVATDASELMNGTEEWTLYSSNQTRYSWRHLLARRQPERVSAITGMLSNSIPLRTTSESNSTDNNRITCRGTAYASTNFYIFTPPSVIDTLSELKAMLSATPLQITYPLETPLIIPLTAQQVLSLIGTNNVFCDIGQITVDYWTHEDSA